MVFQLSYYQWFGWNETTSSWKLHKNCMKSNENWKDLIQVSKSLVIKLVLRMVSWAVLI